MNILLINHYAGSVKLGMEYRPYYLAREWVRTGHEVTIVASSFSHLRTSSPPLTSTVTTEKIDGINYLWIKTPKYYGNGIGRVVNIFSFIAQLTILAKKVARQFNPDLVIASSTYPMDVFPAAKIASIAGAKLVHEVHDLWPLTLMELGGMSRFHPFIVQMQLAENYAYRRADKVVSMLPLAQSHMLQHGMTSEKFVYVPNGIDADEWDNIESHSLPEEHGELIQQLKQKNFLLIGYAGGHALSNALDQLVDAASVLAQMPFAFLFVGAGAEKKALQEKAMSLGLDNVYFLPPVKKAAIPELLSHMDILYLGWRRNPIYRFGICPNKLMDYMMAAKPVIHAVEAGNDLVAESGCGYSVPPEAPKEIADAARRLADLSESERFEMGRRGKEYVTSKHNYKYLATVFLEKVFSDL